MALVLTEDAILDGAFRPEPYSGVTVDRYRGQSLRPLKQAMLLAVNRHRRSPEWSVAILVPTNALAIAAFDYMRGSDHGLPAYPAEIWVAAEGPILASALIALLLEPHDDPHQLAALVLEALASFLAGRTEAAGSTALTKAGRLRGAAGQVRQRGDAGYGARGIPTDVRDLVGKVRQIVHRRSDVGLASGPLCPCGQPA